MSRPAAAGLIDIDTALRSRFAASVERAFKLMPYEAKIAAIESVDLSDFFLNLVRGLPATATDERQATEALAKTVAFRRDLIAMAGGALGAEAVRELLGHGSVQAVYKAAKERRLLMVEDGGTKAFPAFQFDGNAVRPAIARLLAAAPNSNGWVLLQFLTGGEPGPDGRRRIDLIGGSPEEVDRLVRFAQTLED